MRFLGSLLLLLWLALVPGLSVAREILVVTPNTKSPLITDFTTALHAALPQDTIQVSNSDEPATTGFDAIITLGSERLKWRLASRAQTPSIATYVNRAALPEAPLPSYQRIVLANPKPERQLRLARLLLPRARKAGLLYSEHQSGLRLEWEEALANTPLTGESITVTASKNLIRALQQLLGDTDVLMGTDDPAIYNADNLKTILLTSYSRSKVLIGPSAPFIEAGSLSTTYSSPQDMARSVARLLEIEAPGGGLSYPAYFSVLSNAQVARSLGLPVPDDAKLGRELAELEQTP
ncbi:hypothetical protein [Halopseudomonas sabulinigri]|uniref:ABC transporter substrate-binding protein n=1 Tax=Halopseudomonas sabulinigri TaxID=472181 RepID=A0ABP9ZL37_9GAMM